MTTEATIEDVATEPTPTEPAIEPEPQTPEPAPEPAAAEQLLDEVLGQAPVQPAEPAEPTAGADRAPRGMLRDLQTERAKRQAAEAQLAEMARMRAELDELKRQRAPQGPPQAEPDPLADVEDDEFVNAGTVRAAMSYAQRQLLAQQAAQQAQQAQEAQRFHQEADRIGQTFYSDYRQVLTQAGPLLAPHEVAQVRAAASPDQAAKTAYDLCRQKLGPAPAAPVPTGGYPPASPPPGPPAPREAALAQLVDLVQSTNDETQLNSLLRRLPAR